MELNASTTISHGGSTTSGEVANYQSQVSFEVPGGVTYGVQIYAYQQDALVPFTYTGFYNFADYTSIPASGSGEFEGVSTGIFDVHPYCIAPADYWITPACAIPDLPAPPELVPEPPSLTTLLPAVCALGTALFVRKRKLYGKRRASAGG